MTEWTPPPDQVRSAETVENIVGWASPRTREESSINLLLLILSVMIPIYNVAEAAAVGGEIAVPYTASTMINVLICGSVLVLTFHRSEAAILVGKGGKRH